VNSRSPADLKTAIEMRGNTTRVLLNALLFRRDFELGQIEQHITLPSAMTPACPISASTSNLSRPRALSAMPRLADHVERPTRSLTPSARNVRLHSDAQVTQLDRSKRGPDHSDPR